MLHNTVFPCGAHHGGLVSALWVLVWGAGFAVVAAFGALPEAPSACILLVGLDHAGSDENTLQLVHYQLNALEQKQLL